MTHLVLVSLSVKYESNSCLISVKVISDKGGLFSWLWRDPCITLETVAALPCFTHPRKVSVSQKLLCEVQQKHLRVLRPHQTAEAASMGAEAATNC